MPRPPRASRRCIGEVPLSGVDVVSDELAKFVESMLVAPFEITSVEGQQILWF
jgi:hypothetical protein